MRSSTRLSSALFQLTPTRTRCDLIIVANEKKEKIASGLLNPFLAHLKIAQDQVDKGGYSIILEPAPGTDTSWFTKATLERFVRFVSTPEILERVYTIETEILQIEEAIAIQSSNEIGQSIVENHKRKSLGGSEGDKSVPNANEEKAIVLYTPGTPPPEANGSEEGNSRAQLLKVLETRRSALQKEQGMAFARAVAAGFDIDDISSLVSFAECFGAMRLLEACTKFINLWKRKHETGQWLDIDASESLVAQSDFSAINASGIILSTTPNNDESNEPALVNTGKSGSTSNADNPVLNGQQEYAQGQFPHFLFPPWPMHAPPGGQPVFQAYPVQGMPYYPPYAGNGLLFQPPQHSMEHSSSNFDPQSGVRQPLDVMGGSTGQETAEITGTGSLDNIMLNSEASHGRKSRKESGGSNKKQSGMVVIRNINYITSKEKKSHSDTNSDSHSDADTVHESSESDDPEVIHHNKKRSSKRGGNNPKSADRLRLSNDEAAVFGISGDNRQWQAFQDCLLKGSDEGARVDNKGMFAMEKRGKIKKLAAGDELSSSSVGNDSRERNGPTDIEFSETGRRKILSRTTHEDFMIGNRHKQGDLSDPLAVNSFEGATSKTGRNSSHRMSDETLVVPFRSMSIDQGTNGTAIDIDSEIPSKYQKLESAGNKNKVNYEPDDLSLMPERRNDKRSIGYDLTLDYEMQGYAEGSQGKGKKSVTHVKGVVKKTEKDRRSKMTPGSLNKQKPGGLVRKSYPSKMTASEDARARAERLRSYKAEMQKMKKEMEDAEKKRLEALKLARQKRIASRGGSSPAVKQSTPSPQSKQPLAKLSPATSRGSKFSDLGPGSSSPLQRSKIRTSLVSSEPHKVSKDSKLKEVSRTSGHRVTRSSSSLSETKREKNDGSDSKASISRIRRLSEPKNITYPPVTTTKTRSAEGVLKRKLFQGPEKNKVSAIIDLDRSKAATLPELKIKTTKSHINTGENRSAGEKHKTNEARPSAVPKHAEKNANSSYAVHQIDAEDNPIVEKSVVVLESEKPSLPVSYSSDAKSEVRNQQQNNRPIAEKNGMMSESARVSVPPSMNKEPISSQLQQSDRTELPTPERNPPNFVNITTDGKPYQAPHARVSSLEDETHQSNYGKVPLVRTEPQSQAEDKVRTRVPDVKALHLDKHQLLSEKYSAKDSPKGLRRLLKFGKKSHTSSSMDQSFDSDCTTGDGTEHGDSAKVASTSQAHTLKNLISHDDHSPAGIAPTKSSRPFSLLSPFWGKSSEKKQAS